jgi:CBS domain-containing protein
VREQDPHVPVRDVLTRELVTVRPDQSIFDGLLLMIRHDIGHLVVLEGGRLAGIVSERDWLTYQEQHPAALLRQMDLAASIEELAALRAKANRLVRRLFMREGTAEALTHLVTEINDRVVRRVIELCLVAMAEAGEGERPAPFAWIAMGSEGRSEQTLSTDQDNGLVFAEVPAGEVERVQGWFLRFAARVVAGMEVCGFPRCKGNVMASNPELCLPLSRWQRKFAAHLHEAHPQALMDAQIQFDFRCLYGEAELVQSLWDDLLGRMETQRGFLRHLAGMSMDIRPPIHTLGWRLRTLLRLTHPPLDLKVQALGPLVAAVRVLALAAGTARTNTLERLRAAQAAGVVPEDLARAARSAYDHLMLLRIRQHFAQQERGEAPSNELVPEDLNPLRRRFLVEAIQTVMDLQDYVYEKYGGVPIG